MTVKNYPALVMVGLFLVLTACAGLEKKKDVALKSADAHYNLGVQTLNEGNYQAALIELRKAERFRPRDPRIHSALGLAYFYAQRYDDAEGAYRKALSLQRDYSEAHMNLGALYARQGKCDQAIAEFRDALENPFYATPAKAYHNIGLCQRLLGEIEEAERSLKDAVNLDPTLLRAKIDLGILYYQENRLDEAVRVFQELMEEVPLTQGDPDSMLSRAYLHYWVGLSYFKNADKWNARTHFEEAERLSAGTTLAEDVGKYLDLLR
jgi:type IV pilus biogenesis/stability protein PilW